MAKTVIYLVKTRSGRCEVLTEPLRDVHVEVDLEHETWATRNPYTDESFQGRLGTAPSIPPTKILSVLAYDPSDPANQLRTMKSILHIGYSRGHSDATPTHELIEA